MAIASTWPGIDRLSSAELAALERAARAIGTPPDCLAAVIAFETGGTFDPAARNPASGATGLIQFLPSTATALGTTVAELAELSFPAQLSFVVRFFRELGPRVEAYPTCDLLYLAVFFPRAVVQPDAFVIARRGEPAYDQNRGLDTNGDGTLTRGDVRAFFRTFVRAHSDEAPVGPPFRPAPPPATQPNPSGWFVVALLIGGALALRRA